MLELGKIYNMDCMEGMKQFPDKFFDLAIVDPPYTAETKNLDNYLNKMRGHGYSLRTLNTPPNDEYFIELFRISANQIIWGGNYFPSIWAMGGRGFIFWYKQNPVKNFADGELAWTSFNINARCFDYRYFGNIQGAGVADNKIHPTQKPVALYKWLLRNYAQPSFKILDTHVGSASSIIAFEDFGCEYIGFEIDEEYYSNAVERVSKYKEQLKLF